MSQVETNSAGGTTHSAGMIALLLTDIEGSTRLWEEHFDAMSDALVRHNELVHQIVPLAGGTPVRSKGEGDSTFSMFQDAASAAKAALDLQLAMAAEKWPTPMPIRSRMAVHAEFVPEGAEALGAAARRAAGIRGIAHGGQIIVSEPARDSILQSGAELQFKDLGAHRLKDLSLPERIYQLCHPQLQSEFPPLKSLDSRPNNLPTRLTSFYGREREMKEVEQLLHSERLVTITGPEGSGKSRLALQLAADELEEFTDGVWLTDLSIVTDPGAVPAAVGAVLRVKAAPGAAVPGERRTRLVERRLIDIWRTRKLLVILDGCDGVAEAVGDLVSPVMRACGSVKLLVTARKPIGLPGEREWEIPPLPYPTEASSIEELISFESVQLFVDRAQKEKPGFALTEQESAAVAKILQLLQGNPLRIERVAEFVKLLTPTQIAARLERDPERFLRPRKS